MGEMLLVLLLNKPNNTLLNMTKTFFRILNLYFEKKERKMQFDKSSMNMNESFEYWPANNYIQLCCATVATKNIKPTLQKEDYFWKNYACQIGMMSLQKWIPRYIHSNW